MSRAGSPKRAGGASPKRGAGGGIVVKNTFIDVFKGEDSDSDETGCASPHRRNNSAPPSPTRNRRPEWDLQDNEAGSDQEEEDEGVIPTYGFGALGGDGDMLRKYAGMGGAGEYEVSQGHPDSPQAIRPRKQQQQAWAGADRPGGLEMGNAYDVMNAFKGSKAPGFGVDPFNGLGGHPSLDMDPLGGEGGVRGPAGLGYSLSAGLGHNSLGVGGLDVPGNRQSEEEGLLGMGLGGLDIGLPDPGLGRPGPRHDSVGGGYPGLGRYQGFDGWGGLGAGNDQASLFAADPYGGMMGQGLGGCDGSFPCYPPPPGPPPGEPCLGHPPPSMPPRMDAGNRRDAHQPRGRKPDRQAFDDLPNGKPCGGRAADFLEAPAYIPGFGSPPVPPPPSQQPLLSFPPPPNSPPGSYGGGYGGSQVGGKGSGHDHRGPPPPPNAPRFPAGFGSGLDPDPLAGMMPLVDALGEDAPAPQPRGRGNKSGNKNVPQQPWVAKPGAMSSIGTLTAEVLEAAENKNQNAGAARSKADAEAAKSGRQPPLGGGGGPKRTNYLSKYGSSSDSQAAAGAASGAGEQQITTMMLKNIPCRKSQEEVMMHVDQKGYAGRYDFFYLPRDVKFRANLGYAFINFITQEDALRFQNEMNGYRFVGSGSSKACSVVPAHVQGLMNNLAAFKRTEVMRSNRKPFFSGVVTL